MTEQNDCDKVWSLEELQAFAKKAHGLEPEDVDLTKFAGLKESDPRGKTFHEYLEAAKLRKQADDLVQRASPETDQAQQRRAEQQTINEWAAKRFMTPEQEIEASRARNPNAGQHHSTFGQIKGTQEKTRIYEERLRRERSRKPQT